MDRYITPTLVVSDDRGVPDGDLIRVSSDEAARMVLLLGGMLPCCAAFRVALSHDGSAVPCSHYLEG